MNETSKMNNKINYDDRGIEALAIAITTLAAIDYQAEFNKSKEYGEQTAKLTELKDWFNSELGGLCAFGNAEYILEQIHKGVPVVATCQYEDTNKTLSVDEIRFIKTHYRPYSKDYNLCTLSKMFNVSSCTIYNIVTGGV